MYGWNVSYSISAKIVYSVIDRMDILSDINTEPYVLKRIGQPPAPIHAQHNTMHKYSDTLDLNIWRIFPFFAIVNIILELDQSKIQQWKEIHPSYSGSGLDHVLILLFSCIDTYVNNNLRSRYLRISIVTNVFMENGEMAYIHGFSRIFGLKFLARN